MSQTPIPPPRYAPDETFRPHKETPSGLVLSEAEIKIWNQIQATKKLSAERPELDVKERLRELRLSLYERTGGSGD